LVIESAAKGFLKLFLGIYLSVKCVFLERRKTCHRRCQHPSTNSNCR